MSKQVIVGFLVIWAGCGGILQAQEPVAQTGPPEECACAPDPEPGPRLRKELFVELLVGSYNTSKLGPPIDRHFDYLPVALRLGCRPCENRGGWLGERFSLMIEGLVAPVTHDFGHVVGGPSVLARLDICDPAKPVVPYFQVGTGFVLNDGFKDSNQRAIGQCFEFLQQVEVGVRWKLNSNISVLAEGGWQHISNADLARRNLGANNLGGSIGLRWSFGGR